jgi:membrane-associated phospholipid phosphatase
MFASPDSLIAVDSALPLPAAAPAALSPDTSETAGRALAAGIIALVLAYICLFALGFRFLIMKTAVMPIFLLYAVMLRRRAAFVTEWLPLLAGTVLFDAVRGAIFLVTIRYRLPVHAVYPIELERALFRTPAAPLVLQFWRTHWLDVAAVTVHGSHFAFFLLFGLVLWHLRPGHFAHYRRALLLVMAIGLFGYFAVPSIPPWMASARFHLLPPIDHVVWQIYNRSFPELYGVFDTNPIAAMPSLHVAFPVTCALIAFGAYGKRAGVAFAAYAVAVMFAVVYLGEHYAVDIVAGIGVAIVAVVVGRRPWRASLSLADSLGVCGALVGLTVAILIATR